MKKNFLPLFYLVVFFIFWIILAINPISRHTWFVENTLLIVFLILLISTYHKFKFSNFSYTLIFIFSILQTIGAHYTYSSVPIDWLMNFFGSERNHYDRIVHFSFGFLLSYPFREFFVKTSKVKNNFWIYYFPIEMAFGTGSVYEIIEWIYAVYNNEGLSAEFLGSQGDIWDAQKDMCLAGIGASIAMIIAFIFSVFKKNNYKNND